MNAIIPFATFQSNEVRIASALTPNEDLDVTVCDARDTLRNATLPSETRPADDLRTRGAGQPKRSLDQRVGGRYLPVRELGRGASATVYQAWDCELSRKVALKIFILDAASEHAVGRVVREAQASSRIVSDHVIRIHNTLTDPALGVAAIDMELCGEIAEDGTELPGRDLSKAILPGGARTQFQFRRAAQWTMEAALGVRDAHHQGIFHRDLKPANILVRPVTQRAQVLDFGIAALQSNGDPRSRGVGRQTLTVTHYGAQGGLMLAGTPAYMAPEQAVGLPRLEPNDPEHRRILASIDVYGLGAILFELLAGRAPHEARDSDSLERILARARANEIPFHLLRKAPRRLQAVVRRALSTDPRARYASPQRMADDLGHFLASRPMEHDRRNPFMRLLLAARRRPQIVSMLLATLVLLGVAGQTHALSKQKDVLNARIARAKAAIEAGEREQAAIEAEVRTLNDEVEQHRTKELAANNALEVMKEDADKAKKDADAARENAKTKEEKLNAQILEKEAENKRLRVEAAERAVSHGNEIRRLQADRAEELQREKGAHERAQRAQRIESEDKIARRDSEITELKRKRDEQAAALEAKDQRIRDLEAASRPKVEPVPQPNGGQ